MSILQWLRGKWAPGGSALPPPYVPRQSSFPELTRPTPPMPPIPLGPTTIEIRDDCGRVVAVGRGANLGEALTNLRKVTAP